MPRWDPDSRGRLEQAAYELYAERGFDKTTVAEIAARAGVTERTFFRHFADKREVLFAATPVLEDALVSATAGARATASPMEAAAAGVEAFGELLPQERARSRRRQAIIDSSAELRERELIKLASLSETLARALRERGVDDATANLTAEVAIAVFRSAYARWLAEDEERAFPPVLRESLEQLRVLAA